MVLGSLWFATMAKGTRFALHSFTTAEPVFYRGLVSVVFMAVVVASLQYVGIVFSVLYSLLLVGD